MLYKKTPIAYTINNETQDVTNLLLNVDISDLDDNYIHYYMLSSENALEASLTLYDTSEYYWVLFLLNDIVNPFEDWHMSQEQLKRYVKLKYKNPLEPNYFYYIDSGNHLTNKKSNDMLYLLESGQSLPENISFKTNFEYEVEKNDKKKIIKYIDRKYILEFINMYQDRLNKL